MKNSTYTLVMQSQDPSRTLLETAIYAMFILSAVFSIWQFAAQTTLVPQLRSSAATHSVTAAAANSVEAASVCSTEAC